jgi:hypothetical protein
MNSRGAISFMAFRLGVLLTLVLHGAAYCAFEAGAETASRALSWPNTLLQSLVPCHWIGTVDQPFCEGTPLNLAAYLTSFPLGVGVYTSVAYVFLRRRAMASGGSSEQSLGG